jgi:pyruvate/oxaloacetate carboxyltransferase
MADMSYLKALEAGADGIDTAISSLALGTSQPPTETMVATLRGSKYETGVDLEALVPVARHFLEVRKNYADFESEANSVDTNVLLHQVPGGMISNLHSQLKEQGALDKLDAVLAEIPRVRADMGYPPLVTPSSQFVGTQAVLNVMMGERYKMLSREVRTYVQGLYGEAPGPISQELKALVLSEGEEMVTVRPADLLEPEMEKAREVVGSLARSEEDVLSYALFPSVAAGFFEARERGGPEPALIAAIAAAIDASVAPSEPMEGAHTNGVSPWKLAGRQMLLAQRW